MVSDGEFFGEDAGFRDGGDETGVAGPTRQDMKVDVAGDSGAGAFAEVHA